MIKKIERHNTYQRVNKVVWYSGRPFTFLCDAHRCKYKYAAVSEQGTLTLFECKPEPLEPNRCWSDGYPFYSVDVANVVLDEGYDWKLSLTEIVVEDCPSLQELFEFQLENKAMVNYMEKSKQW